MNVSVAEDENTYTSITTAARSHPWPQRRCSVSLCLVREWLDEKTDNTYVQYLSLQFLLFVDEQNYVYRMMKNTLFVHCLHLYTVILLPIYIQYAVWICLSTIYEYLTVATQNTTSFWLSTSMVLAQLGHLVGLLSLSQDTSKGVESIYWLVYVQLCNERWWYAPISLVSNLLFSSWPLTSQTNKLATG